MLEGLYLGSEQVEKKYLHNFSREEKKVFCLHIQKEQEFSKRIKQKLDRLMAEDCSAVFREGEDGPRPSTALDIKYTLNQIAANDPRVSIFGLSGVDAIDNPDRLALDIAKAFRNNTNCKIIYLNGIGLTDNGMLPILRTLGKKELYELGIMGNQITGKSLDALVTIMSRLGKRWGIVNLGKVQLTPEQEYALERYPNLSFEKVKPETQMETPSKSPANGVQKPTMVQAIRSFFQRQ